MSHKKWIFLVPLLIFVAASFFSRPVSAGPDPQVVYQTPTALPDGRVIYIVEDGDSCLRIQLLTGTTIEQLRTLNKLDQNCTINPRQELLLMIVTPVATATPNPDVTATPLLPTPTPFKGNGTICIVLFDDINGNAVHESDELTVNGGAVSISDRTGSVAKTGETNDKVASFCENVPEGEYNISMAIPSGYNATTMMNRPVNVQAGDQSILEFGAQISTIQPPPTAPVENNMTFALLGGMLVVLGIGLAVYVFFFARR